jgi:anthranilate synthase component 1
MKYKLKYYVKPADTLTPVSVYLRVRDQFPESLLLESSDYNSNKNSFTFIVAGLLENFQIKNGKLYINDIAQGEAKNLPIGQELKNFMKNIKIEQKGEGFQFNGIYGYTGFEAVKYFDTLEFVPKKHVDDIPEMNYGFYRFIVAINHFNDDVIILENIPSGEESQLDDFINTVYAQKLPEFHFEALEDELSPISDEDFKELVNKGKEYCRLGEVFQIVFSRRFSRSFRGDEFNVYRALRSINPSPYLFYFDYGQYKLFGSSPESQLVISEGQAKLNPIAGTYKKTGDVEMDKILAKELSRDPKENAEHTMLVDLARNDLGKFCSKIQVTKYKDIQHFSHVIHIVSEVVGEVDNKDQSIDIFGATFPAGTLSGAPKYRALQLIHQDEQHERSFYGGTVGIISLTGDINTAITIRSILSQNGRLHYQAGAGIVVDSVPENELKEVENKLGALRKAIKLAQKFNT